MSDKNKLHPWNYVSVNSSSGKPIIDLYRKRGKHRGRNAGAFGSKPQAVTFKKGAA